MDFTAIVDRGFTLLNWAFTPTEEQKECYGPNVKWYDIIDVELLNIADGEDCILGQLSGGEYAFLLRDMMFKAYGMDESDITSWRYMRYKPHTAILNAFGHSHGFSLEDYAYAYDLNTAWKQAILEWRQKMAEKTYDL